MSTDQHHYVILQLRAPVAAFGGAAIDSFGVTRRLPARSMLTGLLANALGYQRQQFEKLQKLQSRIVFATGIDSPVEGRQFTDFQTAQIQKNDKHWTTRGIVEGRDGGSSTYDGPHLRYRDYLDDLSVHVAFTLTDATPEELNNLVQAFNYPARPLFIGRKGCLPSSPLYLNTVVADTALTALFTVPIGGETNVFCQWMEECEHVFLDGFSEEQLCDDRDWSNGQHTGSRRVYTAAISARHFAECA